MPDTVDALLEMIRQPQRSDAAFEAMLDLFERDPAALSLLLIQAMEAQTMRCEMLVAASELLPDEDACEVYRFAWSSFKAGSSHGLVSEICLQAARSAPGLLRDDWDAVLRLSESEEIGGLVWQHLPAETGYRWIREAKTKPPLAQWPTRNALKASGIAELQLAANELGGPLDEPWGTVELEARAGKESRTGRALHGRRGLHLRFGAKIQRVQLADFRSVVRRFQRLHPTWAGGKSRTTARMGGRLEGRCGICGAPLQRLLDLDVRLVGPCSIPLVTFGLCLACPDTGESGWCHGDPVFFRHDEQGRPDAHESQELDPRIVPDASTVLLDLEVELVELPCARWEPVSYSGGWQNYSRVGGAPSWVQSGMYLSCPDCHRSMFFVMQLDSHVPLTDGSLMPWMNGGMLYTFWCDQCLISAHYSEYS
ncbi:hypothetical protein Q0S19_09760 [Stenotrophomonas indicatrix]|jgi:hypothetical protein|uniref:hypothetical protein n=1 Tax=Stenotrophomonas TaxID=40323 RepID=UPI00264ABF50|nr:MULTISPECIES: hypothetical protein [Stenotrophomonas]MDN8644748.1 hypothetical protein [Stenotrophomonas indicatrix]MDN8653798.1 hypothetical protein [Stenotrophomonas indicatrix]MDV3514273.1 hypothetical protein [Stenotrophomonas sp. C1657]